MSDLLERRLQREIKARKQAETILEQKALELYQSNLKLQKLNEHLEATVAERTKELQESEARFKTLVESAGDIIYNASPSGKFTYANPVTERLLGYTTDDILQMHYLDLVREDMREEVQRYYGDAVKSKRKATYYEFPVVTKEGEVRWLGQTAQIDFKGKEPVMITAVARDISALKQVQEALEASENKYRGIIQNMELGLVEVDQQGKVIFANSWFCEMTGYSVEELKQSDLEKLLLTAEGVEKMRNRNEKRKDGEAEVYEIQLRRKDERLIWVAISGAPFYNPSGKMIGSVGIHLDITNQKKLQNDLLRAKEVAEKARQAEKEFLAHMSHEIRTPLNAVVGMANLLGTTQLNADQREYVNDIQYAGDILHGLISEVLDISKIESGEVEMVPSELNVNDVLSMVCKTMEHRAKERFNTINYKVDKSVPVNILADRNFVNQILLNLIGNAVKFTENGLINVDVSYRPNKEDKGSLIVNVADTGIGIEQAKLQKIFEPYKQEKDNFTQSKHGGTGLGLSIVKQLVKIHGGSIDVFSKKGKGSSFTFSLSIGVAKGDFRDWNDQEKSEKNYAELEGKQILVAEDSYLNQKYIKGLLKQWGVECQFASDGQQAIAEAKKTKYDIILMDMQMPLINGYEATQEIRNNEKNPNCRTPILALTASALLDEKEKALGVGMDGHLTKPFTPDQLLNYLILHLGKSKRGLSMEAQEVIFSTLSLPDGIDANALSDFYGKDIEYALNMIGIFLRLLDKQYKVAVELLKENDLHGLKSWFHKQSPGLNMLGIVDLSNKYSQIELKIKAGSITKEEQKEIPKLVHEFAQQEEKLKQLEKTLLNYTEND
ncbi:PAS domain S-box protein [Owenweeksia hongkongensis]|uniref:PAS domain S-box protein n=1 Tax=Owenweeksia hongkongensis TaxID=253245 RepID=UPI003A92CD62